MKQTFTSIISSQIYINGSMKEKIKYDNIIDIKSHEKTYKNNIRANIQTHSNKKNIFWCKYEL